jgi:hypothetical protein
MPDSQAWAVVRRQDRAVTDEDWIRALLRRAPVCALATVQDGQPLIHTNLFAHDEDQHCIYFHTARQGRTRAAIEADPGVCLSVMEMGRLLPADTALEFSVEFAGVTVFGRARVIDDDAEATRGLQLLLNKYAPHLRPGQDYRPPVESELRRTTVFRIDIDAWSGKKKEVDPDFPGAYWFESAPMLASLARRQSPG